MASYAIGSTFPELMVSEKTAKNNGFRGAKLTARGRFAFVLSLLVLIASGYSAFSGASAESARDGKAHLEVIIVAPGETLWSIAALLGGSQEENVARIIELNALTTPQIASGTRLIIPTRE